MKKKVIFAICLVLILSVVIGAYWTVRQARTVAMMNQPPQYTPWMNVNVPKAGTKKLLTSVEISKSTKTPLIIDYQLGSVTVKKIFYGKDIWTADGLGIPGVNLNDGKSIKADFGFGIWLDVDDVKLRYASFRASQPDGAFDMGAYKTLGEKTLSTQNSDTDNTADVMRYTLELAPVDVNPVNPIFKVNVVSEEVSTGHARNTILQ